MRRSVSNSGASSSGEGSASLLRALFILVLWLQVFSIVVVAESVFQSEDYYCGESWAHAAQICTTNCTSGEDSECVFKLGESFGCYGFTGCHAKLISEVGEADELGGGGSDNTDAEDTADDVDADFAVDAAAAASDGGGTNNFCGQSWVGAMVSCSKPCPQSTECMSPDRCFAATNCDKPLEQLVSEMITTLSGPDIIMELEDLDIFGGTVYDFIKELAEVEGVSIGDVEPQEQTVVSRRILQDRAEHRRLVHGHDRFLHYDITNITLRRLPVGSSALDVSMVVTGDYRPPPYLDLDVIAEESINRNAEKVVKSLQERGARQGRAFFDQVQGIETVRAADMTQRPTVAPTDDPTVHPSMMPSSSPSNVPSSIPSMTIDREILCGTGADLAISDSTTKSYGYIFNMRTKIDAPVVLITGMDFYTQVTEEVNYQVWSRIGNFKDYKADKEGWDLIAMGTTLGRGVGRYTSIPEETFTPVDIPGGGGDDGIRAFYITLDTINLAYKVADEDMSVSDSAIWAEAPEIEIWEGEGVLSFERLDEPFSVPPLPDANELMYWKSPRQFLGIVRYDRLPCKPFSAYGPIDDLPCPLIPTGSPTLPQPSQSPMTLSPSISPTTSAPVGTPSGSPFIGQTSAPTGPDTESPTISKEPTLSPTTGEPTMAPLVPMRANIITKLRNVPERQMTDRESEKFIEIVIALLKRYAGTTMIVEGIDLWHQELTVVDAKEGYVAATNITNDFDEENLGNSSVDVDGKQRDRRIRAYDSRPTGPIKEKEEEKPQVPAMEITLILRISVSNLPSNLLGSMASVTIQEHKHVLINLLQEQQAFYSFFRLVDGVESRVIDEVTFPPTDSPTSLAYFTEQQEILLALEEEEDTGEDSGISLAMYLGLGIGFLWCCLTAISLTYLMNARNEMKERHELEEFLKTKKTDTVSLLEDEKTCPLSPNEDHDKNMGVHFVTSDDQAGAIDPTNDNVRISQEDDFRRKSYVGGFATDRARLKLEVEGVRGRRHTLQPSHRLTHQQRMQVKLEEGSTKSYSNKSEPSVRSSSSSTVQSSIPDKSRMRSHRNSLQPSHELTYQQRMKLKMDEQSSARSSSSVSSSTTESSTADKSRMRSHRNSLQPSHELTYQQRMNLKMDEQSSARSSSSLSSSTTESSTADKARMKSEGGGVRGRRHTSLPSHELTFEQRLKIKMDDGRANLYNNKSESNVRSSHRERSASNGKKTENRVPDRKATVDNAEPLSSSSPQKIRRNPVAVSKSMVDAKRRSGTDRDRRSSSVIGQ